MAWICKRPGARNGYQRVTSSRDTRSSLGILKSMGKLVRRTLKGDQPLAEWSASDRCSYDAAASVFERELDAGYAAVRADGLRYDGVRELPRDAELVILATAMGGG
jgi:hypothetical protein